MPTKPYQSKLIPYEDEIKKLRRSRPPMTYQRIAELLREKYNLTIQRAAIFKFLKVRSRGRKVYAFDPRFFEEVAMSRVKSSASGSQQAGRTAAATTTHPEFRFTPSDRYNLTRLPPEEAAARRKKLEEKGH